jgi:tetratricopeptide (TPR) repeat protein
MALTGCQKKDAYNQLKAQKDLSGHFSFPEGFSNNHFEYLIKKGKVKQASLYVNKALSKDIHNPALHILNGLVYERLRKVDPYLSKDLPYIAYRTAKTLDSTLWLPHQLLGQASMQNKRYQEAQDHFVNAVILKKDLSSFYGLACASYAVCDLGSAKLAVDSGLRISPKDEKMLRAGVLVYAALNQMEKSKELLETYKQLSGRKEDMLCNRVLSWEGAYQEGRVCTVAMDAAQEQPPVESAEKKEPSVVVDAHLAFHDTLYYERKGQNLLLNDVSNPLMVTLGAGVLSQSGGLGSQESPNWGQTTAYNISMGAITYSMNIANTNTRTLEVYYRPSIETTLQKPSFIFSGVMINAAPQGGQVVKLDLGEKLELTVNKVTDDGDIEMYLMMSLAELKESEDRTKSLDSQTLSISQLKLSTTVSSYSGQTSVLGGLTWERAGNEKQGIPFIGSLPFLQYFSSFRRNAWDRVKVYCFVTPRLVGEKKVEAMPKFSKCLSENYKRLIENGIKEDEGSKRLSDILYHLNASILLSHYRSDDLVYRPFQERNVSILRNVHRLKTFLYF